MNMIMTIKTMSMIADRRCWIKVWMTTLHPSKKLVRSPIL